MPDHQIINELARWLILAMLLLAVAALVVGCTRVVTCGGPPMVFPVGWYPPGSALDGGAGPVDAGAPGTGGATP